MPAPAAAEHPEETLRDVVARYEHAGFRGQFGTRPAGRILCFACRGESDAHGVPLLALRRLEGSSDPGEEVAVAAVECPACRTRGTLALTYGVGAAAEDAVVLGLLRDRRGGTGIPPGL
jgi:hypothetical protein